jgi:hypothetical protein
MRIARMKYEQPIDTRVMDGHTYMRDAKIVLSSHWRLSPMLRYLDKNKITGLLSTLPGPVRLYRPVLLKLTDGNDGSSAYQKGSRHEE